MRQANPEHPEHAFAWTDGLLHQDHQLERIYYSGFTLNGVLYNVGDCVSLNPEHANLPVYLGRILGAFEDCSAGSANSQYIQVSLSVSRQLFACAETIFCTGPLV